MYHFLLPIAMGKDFPTNLICIVFKSATADINSSLLPSCFSFISLDNCGMFSPSTLLTGWSMFFWAKKLWRAWTLEHAVYHFLALSPFLPLPLTSPSLCFTFLHLKFVEWVSICKSFRTSALNTTALFAKNALVHQISCLLCLGAGDWIRSLTLVFYSWTSPAAVELSTKHLICTAWC